MCGEFKYLESLEFENQLSNTFACEYSMDGRISIITGVGIYILQLCLKPENTTPSICFKRYYIPVENYVLGTKLGIDPNKFAKDLCRNELYELCLTTNISPKLYLFNEVESKISMAKWSPSYIDKSNCVLAVLNNTGSLNIYARIFTHSICENYLSICNVSEHIISLYKKKNWKIIKNLSSSDTFEELKLRIQIKPTTFTWSKLFKFEEGNFAFLIIGHLNGDVTIWKYYTQMIDNEKEGNIKCISKINTNLKHITALHLEQTNDRGLLLAGDFEGNVIAIPLLQIKFDDIKLGELSDLWMENDKIKVQYFYVLLYNNSMYLICLKHDFLLIYLLNKTADVVDRCTFHVGNLDVAGIEKVNENTLLVTTITGVTKEIQLTNKFNKIDLTWRHVYININWSVKRVHGIVLTKNKVLLCVLTYPCRIRDKKDDKNFANLVLFENLACDPLNLLINNESNSLHNYWDCFEVLRVQSIINKQLPCNRLKKPENYDGITLHKLKTYLHISKISETVFDLHEIVDAELILKPYKTLKCLFEVRLTIYRMKYLLELHSKNQINEFQLQNLFILNNCLKEFIANEENNKLIQGRHIIKKITDVIKVANNLEYPEMPQCAICNNSLLDSSCLPNHFETRCALTMMPLNSNSAYKCPFCKIRFHVNLENEVNVLFCPYCDIAMDLHFVKIEDDIPESFDKETPNADNEILL